MIASDIKGQLDYLNYDNKYHGNLNPETRSGLEWPNRTGCQDQSEEDQKYARTKRHRLIARENTAEYSNAKIHTDES